MNHPHKRESFAVLCNAMAHPSRLAVLEYLASVPGCYFAEICLNIPLAKSTISQHLKILRESGLVTERAEGTKVYYAIEREKWREAKGDFADFFANIYRERGLI